jgi:mannose-6-phosphate isomerase-like protein (cupin superfamily)
MMSEHMRLPDEPTATAPDGSDVRVLVSSPRGGLAHFEFPPAQTSPAVRHRTVDELWYFVAGRGQMWTSTSGTDAIDVQAGVCVSIPVGTAFQVRSSGDLPLAAVAATIPPWPGEGEAEIVDGPWEPSLEPGPH